MIHQVIEADSKARLYRAKCGATRSLDSGFPKDFSIWPSMTTCPDCLVGFAMTVPSLEG